MISLSDIKINSPDQRYLAGDKESPYDFIRACRVACGENKILKVILETGALKESPTIQEVSECLCEIGVDFLKTSTGKIAVGATLEAAYVMLGAIKKSGRSVGLKVSGGIRTIEQATHYMELAVRVMGADWLTPAHFRIGASQLLS